MIYSSATGKSVLVIRMRVKRRHNNQSHSNDLYVRYFSAHSCCCGGVLHLLGAVSCSEVDDRVCQRGTMDDNIAGDPECPLLHLR